MALILAIEPDRAQAAQLTNLIDARVRAELLLAETTEQALSVIGTRVPDLVLIPALLSPQEDAALAGALRVIAAAARVRMLTIPVLAECQPQPARGGMLAKWRRRRGTAPAPNGCEPAVFAEQIATYLAEAAAERSDTSEIGESPAIELREPPMTKLVDEPIAHLIEEPIEQPIAQQVAQPFAQVIEAPIVRVIEQPIVQVIEEPNVQVIEPLVQLIEQPMVQVIEQPIVQLVEEPILQVIEQPIVQLVEEPIVRLVEQPIVQVVEEPIVQLIEEPLAHLIEAPSAERIDEPIAAVNEASVVAVSAEPDTQPGAVVEAEAEVGATAARPSVPAPLEYIVLNPALTEAAFASPIVESAAAMAASAIEPAQESPVDDYVSQAELDRRFFAAGGQSRLRLGSPVLAVRPTPVAPVAVAPPTPPKAERPEWIELIESLRLDLERLRAERTQPAPTVNVPHTAAAKGRAKQPPEETEPTQDQWGLFDPQQCGFAALVAKLEEITDVGENVSA